MRRNKDTARTDRVRFEEALDTRALGRNLRWFESLPSTNDTAREWADTGAPHGALVFADHQTGGRGRHGRTWTAAPGLNLTVSLVLRPALRASQYGLITLGASLAVRDTIEACCPGVAPRIKWPNDILIEDLKCCGMLLESAIGKEAADSYVVLGIGLNVNQGDFPDSFGNAATSLMLGYGRPIDRVLLLADLLRRLEAALQRLESSPEKVISDYERALSALGRTCRLTDIHSGATLEGVVQGVDRMGALRLEIDSEVRLFHAGDVQMVESAA